MRREGSTRGTLRARASGSGRTTESNCNEGVGNIYRDIPPELLALIEPVVVDHDCELVDVEVARNQGRGLLRITVDNRNGDGRVAIERCVKISREVETLLDAADAMPGAYQLEVSSPGLNRLLGREKDFVAAIDQEVKLQTRRPIDGRRRYRGRLLGIDAGVLRMKVDGVGKSDRASAGESGGEEVLIPIDEVEKANSIYEFTSADFAKESSRRDSSHSGGV